MAEKDTLTQETLFYDSIASIAAWYFDSFYEYTVSDMYHVPTRGSLILACNHVSFFDPPAVGCLLPRQLNYFARDTLFKGLFGKGLYKLNCIPVARGTTDVKSLKQIFKALKAGGGIVIFPEGTRSVDGGLGEAKPGAGMIALKSNATVVPTRVFGTYEAYGKGQKYPDTGGRIHIAYGKPMTTADLDPGKDHPERYLEASRRIMERIAALEMPAATLV